MVESSMHLHGSALLSHGVRPAGPSCYACDLGFFKHTLLAPLCFRRGFLRGKFPRKPGSQALLHTVPSQRELPAASRAKLRPYEAGLWPLRDPPKCLAQLRKATAPPPE
jgi:hypothetical protein